MGQCGRLKTREATRWGIRCAAPIVALAALVFSTPLQAANVAIVKGSSFYTPDLFNNLTAAGETVTEITNYTAASLAPFNAVIMYGNTFTDTAALNTYVQGGGIVIWTPWAGLNFAVPPETQVFSDGGSPQFSGLWTGAVALDPASPLLNGVTFPAAGGFNVGRITGLSFAGGAHPVAEYTDLDPLVGVTTYGSGATIGINLQVITSDTAYQVIDQPWAIQLFVNGIHYVLVPDFVNFAQTYNQQQVAVALNQLLGSGADTGGLKAALIALAGSELPAALDALSGEIHPALATSLLVQDRRFLDIIAARFGFGLSQLGGPMPYADPAADGSGMALGYAGDPFAALNGSPAVAMHGGQGWATGYGGFSNRASDGNGAAVDAWSGGFAAGYDGVVGSTLLGVAAGYGQEGVNLPARNSHADVDTGRLAAYFSSELGAWKFSGIAEYAFHGIDTSRQVAFPGFDMTATAAYQGHQASLYGELGREFAGAGGVFEPFVGVRYGYLHLNGFTETGAGAANLSSSGSDYQALDTVLGIRANTTLTVGGHQLVPSFGFTWEHGFGDTAPLTNMTLGGAAFSPAATAEPRDRYVIETGLGLVLAPRWKADIDYAATFAGGTVSHDANAKLSIGF